MKSILLMCCCVLLEATIIANSLKTTSGNIGSQALTRKRKDKAECPSTCQLKRKIGKLQNYVQFRFVDIESTFDVINRTLLEQNNGRMGLRPNSQLHADGVNATEIFEESSVMSSSDCSAMIVTMNSTIRSLTQQNTILRRQAQDARDLSDVVREQNHILSSQNRGLRLHSNNIDVRIRQFRSQIESLQETVTYLNRTRSSESNQRNQENELAASVMRNENNLEEAESRIRGLEEWMRIASESGSIPPIATTTSHPQPDTPPNDCQELFQMGYTTSGVYRIRPLGAQTAFDVYCEQDYYGGGWTFIQRRRDGSVDFNRNWDDYETGFGNLDGEFWLGNEKIHQLTNQNTYRLHVVLQDWSNNRAYAEYDGFKLSSARDYYSIRFGRYEGTAGDGLRGRSSDGSTNTYLSRFSTRDYDNDSCTPCLYEGEVFQNCARYFNGGWWFRACADSNLNGNYVTEGNQTSCAGRNCFGIRWRTWRGADEREDEAYSLKASVMMVKIVESDESKR